MSRTHECLEGLPLAILDTLLRYVVVRREEAEENLFHANRHFKNWQERELEPRLPKVIRQLEKLSDSNSFENSQELLTNVEIDDLMELVNYPVYTGMHTGMWASHQGDCDHYAGSVDILRCMESELMHYIGKIQD